MLKLIAECLFQLKQQLCKQIEGCSRGDPLSVILADIQMIRTENGVVKPLKQVFCRQYVDDKYSCKKNRTDQLYHELNNYHPNINLNTEINPKRFLDAEANTKSGKIEITVYIKRTKLPVSKLWHKTNAIHADLHRSKRIFTDFD